MNRPGSSTRELPLFLTEEEAIGLLELCLYSKEENDPARIAAMRKLGDLCREFFTGRQEETGRQPHNAAAPAADLARACA